MSRTELALDKHVLKQDWLFEHKVNNTEKSSEKYLSSSCLACRLSKRATSVSAVTRHVTFMELDEGSLHLLKQSAKKLFSFFTFRNTSPLPFCFRLTPVSEQQYVHALTHTHTHTHTTHHITSCEHLDRQFQLWEYFTAPTRAIMCNMLANSVARFPLLSFFSPLISSFFHSTRPSVWHLLISF